MGAHPAMPQGISPQRFNSWCQTLMRRYPEQWSEMRDQIAGCFPVAPPDAVRAPPTEGSGNP